MRRVPTLLIALLALLLAGADKPKSDEDLLQGQWKVTVLEVDGERIEDPFSGLHEFKGDWYQNHKFRLNAKAKPKEIDHTVEDPALPKPLIIKGIYELDGDNLKICWMRPGGVGRPKDFTAKKDSRHAVLVLKRVKQVDKQD